MINRILITCFVLFCTIIAVAQSTTTQPAQYKVVIAGFYNLENLFDTINDPNTYDEDFTPDGPYRYTGKIYQDKLERLSDVISQIGTEVSPDGLAFWGTAEIENVDVLLDLAAMPKLAKRNYQPIHYNGGDPRGIDCAFMYNPNYFKPIYSKSIPINLSLAVKDGKPTRDVLWVRGVLTGTDTVDVFVGHWPSRRGGEALTAPMRNYVAKIIKQYTDSLTQIRPNAKILVMGDLNDNPTDESIEKYLKGVDKKEKMDNSKFLNPFIDMYKKGYGTLAHNDAWGLFDQILLSNAWIDTKQEGWFYKSAYIFKKDFMVQLNGKYKGYPKRCWNFNLYNAGYSDHFPTYIQLLQKIK
ncbi:MAG: endonuclease/exonuclease/phosphatase family protein [Sphingobacteriales bacterium]|nr:MAG: endonuclease/exonuclease/phosphatase family protein [Sphingobacteriales bacterium]